MICIIGHSMPKRLFKAFDNESLYDGQALRLADGWCTRAQMYAEYFYVGDIIAEVHFFHAPKVSSSKFREAVRLAGALNPDLVLFHASANDLASKRCNVVQVFHDLLDEVNILLSEFGVGAVMFASVLKRADIPKNGKGRLECSVDEFTSRAKKFNRLIKRECRSSFDMMYVLLPRFWYDHNQREIDVVEWSSDRLHPGPKVGSEGFARYYNAIRHMLLRAVPFLGQAKFLARYQ